MPGTACPTPDHLRAFHLGDLPDAAAEEVSAHLDGCPGCESAARALDDVSDGVMAAYQRSARAVPPAAMVPTRVGDYDVLAEIGRGGMGVVYKARHRRLPRTVALKMLVRGSYAEPDERARFRAEADAVAGLQHPNIVQLYEVGEHDAGDGTPRPYFTLEFVEGESLAARLAGRPQPPRQAAGWVEAIARAAHYAHEHGVVHRDLKPSNVLLPADGPPKLCDFGVAKLLTGSDVKTVSGAVLGTIEYMAPEQAAGDATVGPPADVYALGAVLYAALTGRPPFQGTSALRTLEQVRRQDPVPPRLLVPAVPRDVNTICLKCLDKRPAGRYPSAAALADDLHRFLAGEPILARPVTVWERARKWARRRPALAGLVALSVLVLFVGFPGATALWLRADRDRAAADRARADLEGAVYAGRIALADHAYQGNDVAAARQLLDRCGPDPGRPDLRHWEWNYLDRLCRADLLPGLRHDNGDAGWVFGLAFHPDGRSFVSAAGLPGGSIAGRKFNAAHNTPGESKVWDAATGRCLATLRGHAGAAWAVAVSPDGRRFATGGADGSVRLWDAASFADQGSVSAAGGPIVGLAFTPADHLMAVGSTAGVVVWDLQARGPKFSFPRESGGTTLALAASPDGRLLFGPVLHEGAARVRLVDLRTGKDVGHTLPAEVTCAAFSPDGRFLAVAVPTDHRVQVWDAAGRTFLRHLGGHSNNVLALAFAPDGRLASAGDDRTVRVWDPSAGREVAQFRGHPLGVQRLAVSSDGRRLASGDKAGGVKVWDLTRDPRGVTIEPTDGGGEYFDHLAFSADGRSVVVVADATPGAQVHNVAHWDAATGRLRHRHTLGPKRPDEMWHRTYAVSGDAGRLAAADWADARAVNVFDTADGRRVATVHTAGVPVRAVALDGPGGVVAAAGWSVESTAGAAVVTGDLIVADAGTGEVTRRLAVPPGLIATQVAVSPDGRRLAAAVRELVVAGTAVTPAATTAVHVWPLDRGGEPAVLTERHDGPIACVAFSPGGTWVATAGADGAVRLQDTVTGRGIGPRLTATGPVTGLAFSPDGRRLAAVGLDGAVRLWDTAGGLELLTLRGLGPRGSGHYGFTARVAFSPDGARLAANDWDGTVTIWDGGPTGRH